MVTVCISFYFYLPLFIYCHCGLQISGFFKEKIKINYNNNTNHPLPAFCVCELPIDHLGWHPRSTSLFIWHALVCALLLHTLHKWRTAHRLPVRLRSGVGRKAADGGTSHSHHSLELTPLSAMETTGSANRNNAVWGFICARYF